MSRAVAFAKLVVLLVFDWFLLGIIGQQLSLLYLRIAHGSMFWGWVLFGLGIVAAIAAPLVAYLRVHSGRPISWVWRATVVTFPVFFCGQLLIGGSPDWNPVPLLIGWSVCIVAGLVAWFLTRSTVESRSTAAA